MNIEKNTSIRAMIPRDSFKDLCQLITELATKADKENWKEEKKDLANLMFKMWGKAFSQDDRFEGKIMIRIKKEDINKFSTNLLYLFM